MILVDEPGPNRVCGEGRTSHRNIESRLSLQLANRLRVEIRLQPRLRCRHGLTQVRIDDLVGRLPDPREVIRGRREAGNDFWRLPNRHRFVLLASIEIRADRAVEIGNERKCLLAWRRPIEVAVIRDIAIQRRRRSVDQFGHLAASVSYQKKAPVLIPDRLPIFGLIVEWPTCHPAVSRARMGLGFQVIDYPQRRIVPESERTWVLGREWKYVSVPSKRCTRCLRLQWVTPR